MATILIVDDSPVQLRMTEHLLQKQSDHVSVCTASVLEALERLREGTIDLVLTDLHLGAISGLDLLDEMKSAYPNIPAIVMTATGSEEAAIEAIDRGAASYLPKRLLTSRLAAEVARVLDSARAAKTVSMLTKRRMASSEQFALTNDLAVVPALIQTLVTSIAEFELCDEPRRMRIGVALEEALLNAIIHGNLDVSSDWRGVDDKAYERLIRERIDQAPYKDRQVRITAAFDRNRAAIVIRDEGRGFDPSQLPDPTAPENMDRAHGRGLLLIRNFFDEATHNERGNEIRLVLRRQQETRLANGPYVQTLSAATV